MGSSIQPIVVRFQAQGAPQVTAAFQQLNAQAARSGQQISRTFIDGGGRASAFGRQSVQAFNAAGFAASQFAATGTTGFRNLASSAAGFASFFGPGGLIASGVISLGLVLADFWQRQRKEIEETKKVMDSLGSDAIARRKKDEPEAVALEQLAVASRGVAQAKKEVADLIALRNSGGAKNAIELELSDKRLAAASGRVADALAKEFEALRQVNDARAKAAPPAEKVAKASNTTAKALDAEIDALVQLGRQGQLSIADMARLIELQEQFTKSVRDGTLSLVERAAASKRLAETDRGLVIGTPGITDITETTRTRAPGAAVTLPKPNIPPAAAGAIAEPLTRTFGDAFASSLQSGLAAGVTSFIASGDITAMWNNVGSALVSGLAVINPWLAIGGGILQGLIGSMLGGGNRSRGGGFQSTTPSAVDITRLIVDPGLRNPIARQNPFGGLRPLMVPSPEGDRLLASSVNNYTRRGG